MLDLIRDGNMAQKFTEGYCIYCGCECVSNCDREIYGRWSWQWAGVGIESIYITGYYCYDCVKERAMIKKFLDFDEDYFGYLVDDDLDHVKNFDLDEQACNLATYLFDHYPATEKELWKIYECFGPNLYLKTLEFCAMRNHDT